MTDEINDAMPDPIPEPEPVTPEPLKKGYMRVLASEFDTLNAAWTTQKGGCDNYTFATPDADPKYVWARVEDDFIEGELKSREEAIKLGMKGDSDGEA